MRRLTHIHADATQPAHGLQLFSRKLLLSAGQFAFAAGEQVVGPMRSGLKVGVLLDGDMSLEFDDRPPVAIQGATLMVAANLGDHVQQRTGMSDSQLRYALMQFDMDFIVGEFGGQAARILDAAGPEGVRIWTRPATPALRAVAIQMAECAVAPSLRKLYLAGKAMELAALALDEISHNGCERARGSSRLPARLRERMHAVRDLLLADMQHPPCLSELARMSGLNPTSLTSSFRSEFGMSVFAYLQEQRLLRAHELILSGETNVARAAFLVGYTPAYFSSLFQKRFGASPGSLR